ncbi:hypothetical protein [Pseudomonas sp. Irchel s3b2]|uniref:hypothetical protein n=1 Tax=Pseudomonas sp. Irchel s3b2 TaxID=2009073 RepID=UPI000BA3C5F6|nr:hypothetical protein [Pseudomonas sp. Irchel s3b2]
MSNETHKLVIAIEYLNTAATLWVHDLNHYSAMHLAAAAEEISGKQCRYGGTPSHTDELKEWARQALKKMNIAYDEKEAFKFVYASKNAIKHMDSRKDSHVNLDARDEASRYINMAFRNFQKLGLESFLLEAVNQVVHDRTIFVDVESDEDPVEQRP